MSSKQAWVGVTQHGATILLVTVTREGELLDRREVKLTTPGMTSHPHHHEGSWAVGRYLDTPGAARLTVAEAVRLVERVRATAQRRARAALLALARDVEVPVAGLAVRACAPMPPTIEACIRDHRAQTQADSVMYRQAVAAAAGALGWPVGWFDERTVAQRAAASLGLTPRELATKLAELRKAAGAPWQARHTLAATAALSGPWPATGSTARPRRRR